MKRVSSLLLLEIFAVVVEKNFMFIVFMHHWGLKGQPNGTKNNQRR